MGFTYKSVARVDDHRSLGGHHNGQQSIHTDRIKRNRDHVDAAREEVVLNVARVSTSGNVPVKMLGLKDPLLNEWANLHDRFDLMRSILSDVVTVREHAGGVNPVDNLHEGRVEDTTSELMEQKTALFTADAEELTGERLDVIQDESSD